MKTYEGICRGGPWDGKSVAYPNPTLPVVIATVFGIADRGEYRHVAGQWVWHEAQEA